MNSQKVISAIFLVILLVAAASNLSVTMANPLRAPEITVASPQNNYVYSTGDVWLQFTPIVTPWATNYSSYSYVLDGQHLKATNGNTLLTNLPAGSHKLTINGNVSSGYFANQNMELEVIYFSVSYSSNWVTFTLSLAVSIAVASLVLFVNRRPIVVRLRGKKNAFFWLGLSLVVLASLFVVPMGYKMLGDYLFPYDKRGAVEIYLGSFVAWGLVVVLLGFAFMVIGTLRLKFPKWEPPRPKKK